MKTDLEKYGELYINEKKINFVGNINLKKKENMKLK